MASRFPVTGPTRRELLIGSAAVSTLPLLAGRTAMACSHPRSGQTIKLPGADELVPRNMPAGFSDQEIQRRWDKCREWMRRYDFDALIVPTRPGGNADIKWLTESSPNWVVFPQQGRPTAIFRTGTNAGIMRDSTSLDIDIRSSRFDRSEVIVDVLKETGLDRSRIGVGNLSDTLRDDEGGVSHITMLNLKESLPRARFESAVELLMRVKLQRGPEEIEVLKLCSRVSELGLKAMVESSGVGVEHYEVWFQVFKALVDASGEMPGRVSLRAGEEGNTAEGQPLRETLQAGEIMSEEIAGSVLGYLSQVNQAICVGSPAPRMWESTFRFNLELFQELLEWAKPGRSFQDYSAVYKKRMDEWSAKHDVEPYFGVVFHTGGASGDGPRMGWGREDENSDLVIEPGMVFTIKPRVPIPGVAAPACQIGDAVLITDSNAERLGRRRLEPITLGT